MKKILLITVTLFFASMLFAQTFKRDIKLAKPRINGTDVVQLQKMLYTLGYTEVGEADGYFGPMSEKSLKQYEEMAGFNSDGIFSKSVFDFLYNGSFLNILYHQAIAKYNLVTKLSSLKEWNIDLSYSDELEIHTTEGASLTVYNDGKNKVYGEFVFYGEYGKALYTMVPLNNEDFIYVKCNETYEYQFGPVATREFKPYFYCDGKFYELQKGQFVPANSEFDDYVKYLQKMLF